MLAGVTQLFTFLLNKTKSYSRRFLEIKGLDQDRGVWCTTILSIIFPLPDPLFNYSSTQLKGILKVAHRWTGFLLLFMNFSHKFVETSIGHWKYSQVFLNPQENNPSVVQNCKQNIMPLLVVRYINFDIFLIEESRQSDWCKLKL